MFWYRTCRLTKLSGKGKWDGYVKLKVRYKAGAFRMPDDEEIEISMSAIEFESRQILDKMVRNGSMTEVTAEACWTFLWENGKELGYEEGYQAASEDESL